MKKLIELLEALISKGVIYMTKEAKQSGCELQFGIGLDKFNTYTEMIGSVETCNKIHKNLDKVLAACPNPDILTEVLETCRKLGIVSFNPRLTGKSLLLTETKNVSLCSENQFTLSTEFNRNSITDYIGNKINITDLFDLVAELDNYLDQELFGMLFYFNIVSLCGAEPYFTRLLRENHFTLDIYVNRLIKEIFRLNTDVRFDNLKNMFTVYQSPEKEKEYQLKMLNFFVYDLDKELDANTAFAHGKIEDNYVIRYVAPNGDVNCYFIKLNPDNKLVKSSLCTNKHIERLILSFIYYTLILDK